MKTEINLEPNWDVLFARFTRETEIQIEIAFRDMPTHDFAEMAEKRDALRQLQAILAPLNIALHSAVNAESILALRDRLTAANNKLIAKADALDNELNGWEPED